MRGILGISVSFAVVVLLLVAVSATIGNGNPVPAAPASQNPNPRNASNFDRFELTEDQVGAVVTAIQSDLTLVNFSAAPAAQIGENFMSEAYSAKIHVQSKQTGSRRTFDLILKAMPQNPLNNLVAKESNLFEKEAHFYSKIVPDFLQFQRERGLKEVELFNPFPAYFASHVQNNNNNFTGFNFICVENLQPLGFKMADRGAGLDESHCKLALRNLARFHATSFAMFEGDYDRIQEKYPVLEKTLWKKPDELDERIKSFYLKLFKGAEKAGFDAEVAVVQSLYDEPYFYQRLHQMTGERVKNAVIYHGDFWTNNVMFNYGKKTGEPNDLKMIDFQNVGSGSRAVDLNYFLYTSAQIQVLNEKEEELLRVYHDEFTSFCSTLGYTNAELTFEALLEEFQAFRPYGITWGVLYCLLHSGDQEHVPEMLADLPDSSGNNTTEHKNLLNSSAKSGRLVQKLRNIVLNHVPKCPDEWNHTKTP